jgi:DNA-binding Lrp family transcriptional regulator
MDSRTIRITLDIWSVVCLLMRAYVLIDAARKSLKKIITELRQRPGVIVADVINGPHPVIACLEADNPAALAQAVLFDIRKIEGVKDLTVYLSMDGQDTTTNYSLIGSILPDLSASITTQTDNRGRKRNRIK